MAKKYKDMTYTIRKSDNRLMKKITVKGKIKYLYSNNVKDLYEQYNDLMHLKYNGVNISSNSLMKDYSLKWLELNSTGRETRTIDEYKYLINNHIVPSLGYKKLQDIKLNDIKQLIKDMENIPTTAKKTLQLVKRILNDAVDNDLIIKNVAQNVKAPKIIKNERFPLSLKEDKVILNCNSKYAPFFIFMRYTGMRKEEIVPITVDDIDLKNKRIRINKAVAFIHNQPVLKTTKNTKTRYVPILDIIYDLVEALVQNAKNGLLFTKETDNQMLTDSAIKRHLESFLYVINKNKNDSEKIYFTCHQLRHSYCTMLYYSNVGIKKAQELMGHSSADMVYNIYTHLDEQRENAEILINNYIHNINKIKIKGISKLSKSCHYIKSKK